MVGPNPVVISGWKNIPISQLFNFSTDFFSRYYARFASLTFEEELELYDLLEMDAEGDLKCGPLLRMASASLDPSPVVYT